MRKLLIAGMLVLSPFMLAGCMNDDDPQDVQQTSDSAINGNHEERSSDMNLNADQDVNNDREEKDVIENNNREGDTDN